MGLWDGDKLPMLRGWSDDYWAGFCRAFSSQPDDPQRVSAEYASGYARGLAATGEERLIDRKHHQPLYFTDGGKPIE